MIEINNNNNNKNNTKSEIITEVRNQLTVEMDKKEKITSVRE